jgi:hypothetical protein
MAKKIVILSAAAKRNNCHPEAEDSVACDRVPTKDLCTSATKPSVEHAVVGVGTNAPTTAVDFAFARVARASPPAKGFVSGHDFSRAVQIEHAFTGWLKAIP